MRIETFEDRHEVTVNQSFINDHFMCPARARWGKEQYPDGTPPSSASAVGTGMHAGIEAHLQGYEAPTVRHKLIEGYRDEAAKDGFMRTMSDIAAVKQSADCFRAWRRDIEPGLDAPEELEHKFRIEVDSRDNVVLFISGTWDATIGGIQWDWKTASSMYKYRQNECDTAVQPTMYTWARALLLDDMSRTEFKYGIVEKKKVPVGHIRTTRRGPQDWAFLKEQIWSIVGSWQAPPVLNDQGWWCSPKWCLFHSQCKGNPALLTNNQLLTKELVQ